MHALKRQRRGWFLVTPAGHRGPYRFVPLNAPLLAGRKLLRMLHMFAHVTALLNAYEYLDSRILIHTDPAYVKRDGRNCAVYNAGVDGQ